MKAAGKKQALSPSRKILPALFALAAAALVLAAFLRPAPHAQRAAAAKCRIAIFRASGFPSHNCPAGLGPEFMARVLGKDYKTLFVDEMELADPNCLNRENADIIVLAYGENFPAFAFENIRRFINAGGGLVTVAGIPFARPLEKRAGNWYLTANAEHFYRLYLMPLGIRYYEPEVGKDERAAALRPDILPCPTADLAPAAIGLCTTVSQGRFLIKVHRGNVFPERVMMRDFVPLLGNADAEGKNSCSSLVLVKAWDNPYVKTPGLVPQRWLLCSWTGQNHPFNPKRKDAARLINDSFALLCSPVTVCGLRPEKACFDTGKSPALELTLHNRGRKTAEYGLDIKVTDFDSGKSVFTDIRKLSLAPGMSAISLQLPAAPLAGGDLFRTKAILRDAAGRALDGAEAALVIRAAHSDFPALAVSGAGFTLGGEKIRLDGANYYESRRGELNWIDPNFLAIASDFRRMREMGVKIVRIHFHHPDWFKDQLRLRNKTLLAPLLDRFAPWPRDNSPVPAEAFWRILDTHIQLANRFGMVFCADLFTLVPEKMGGCEGWLRMDGRFAPESMQMQKAFLDALARRYRDRPGISWDLWNEPAFTDDKNIAALRDWTRRNTAVLRENGDRHLLTLGGNLSLMLEDELDYLCLHTDFSAAPEIPAGVKKPVIVQEAWLEAGQDSKSERLQAEKMERDYNSALALGAQGFMPWQWTRQARLWDRFDGTEAWDNALGCMVREDGTVKPAGRTLARMIKAAAKN